MPFPTGEVLGTTLGAAAAPIVNDQLGDPAGAAVDNALEGAGKFMENVADEASDGMNFMEQGCFIPICGG